MNTPSTTGSNRVQHSLVAGVLVGLIGLTAWTALRPRPLRPEGAVAWPRAEQQARPVVPALSPAHVRARAWDVVAPRLDALDRVTLGQVATSLALVEEFFQDRQRGTRPFAEDLLSFGGKWAYLKSKMPWADADEHYRYLGKKFEQHVFNGDQLRQMLQAVVGHYVSQVQGLENQLLVHIRADLSESELPFLQTLPILREQTGFEHEYQKMLVQVVPVVSRDVNYTLSKDVSVLLASEVAAKVAIRVGVAVGTRLGVSAGILSAGATSGWATFGVGLVAAIVLDITVDWIVHLAGYDPVSQVEAKVNETLKSVQQLIVAGDPEAWAAYDKLCKLAETDPVSEVRTECRSAAASIERGGHLGLKFELIRLNEVRGKLRREALRRLVLEGETP